MKKHKDCPVCRVPIDFDKAQRVANGKSESEVTPIKEPKGPTLLELAASDSVEYNRMPQDIWAAIQEVEIMGSFGSKIESLVRHLVWLQEQDPGTKSIVFSAWADVSYSRFQEFAILIRTPSHLLSSNMRYT